MILFVTCLINHFVHESSSVLSNLQLIMSIVTNKMVRLSLHQSIKACMEDIAYK